MHAKLDVKYHGPLVVNAEFLTDLNKRLTTVASQYLDDLADREQVPRSELDELVTQLSSNAKSTNLDGLAYKVVAQTFINYDVRWKGGLRADNLSYDELIEMLDFESAIPQQIEATVGKYGYSRLAVTVRTQGFSTAELIIHDNHDRIEHHKNTIWNLFKKSNPDLGFLHSSVTQTLIRIALYAIYTICIYIALDHFYPNEVKVSKSFTSSVFSLVITVPAGFLYDRAFPAVQFMFGSHKSSSLLRKFLWAFISVVIVPVLITYWFAVHPLK